MIHRHDESASLAWTMDFELDKELVLVDPERKRTDTIARSKSLRLGSEVKARRMTPECIRLSYKLGDIEFSLLPKDRSHRDFDLHAHGGGFRFVRTLGRKWPLPRPIKSYAFPDQARTYFQNAQFLSDIESAYEDQLDRVFYLGPLREFPKRDYLWARSRPQGNYSPLCGSVTQA